ncbi:PepSY domain-containing protein, partial [Pseudomonas sp.]
TELEKAALAKHPGAILVEDESELEDSYGRLVYKVELRDAQNVEWKVEMDAKSGEILKDFQDR